MTRSVVYPLHFVFLLLSCLPGAVAQDAKKPPNASAGDAGAPYGIAARTPWTTSRVTGTPDPPPPYRTERVFPRISFQNPVVVTLAPGSDRWFVGEQKGKVYSFRGDPQAEQKDLFLDVRDLLKREPPDSPVKELDALYGLTFHPRFAENRYCYVCYVVRGSDNNRQLENGSRLSRFTVSKTDPPVADLASEQVLITWLQGGHNGGCLKFGPDGYLYVSTGDGSGAFPPDGLNAGQDVTNLLSAVLRIDVDHPDAGRNYSIPKDNPLLVIPGARGEIWAYGMRNPWKMSFDRVTGELWVGDVGWELWELVYHVERGGNYGWSIVEGPQSVHVDRKVGPTPILPPALSIPHTDGVSITGGFVYRGKRLPDLTGQYIFGDWETRRIWAGKWDGKQLIDRRDLVEPAVRIVDFAEDHDGELYVLDYDDGSIHALMENVRRERNQQFPVKLSETGLFSDVARRKPAPGVIPFSVVAEQWSDHAVAERLVAIPGDGVVKLLPEKRSVPGSMFNSSSIFPTDSVLAKTLSLELEHGNPASLRAIETQLLHFDGRYWRAYSFAWNDEQTDATLVGPEGTSRDVTVRDASSPGGNRRQVWRFSSRVECARCHNQWAEHALAFQPSQLNRNFDYGSVADNQLRTLEHIGLIAAEERKGSRGQSTPGAAPSDWHDLTKRQPTIVNPYDESASLTQRARSYLHINCAHCHRNGGGGTAYIQLQRELSLDETKTLGVKPTQGTFGIPDSEILASGDPYRSVLYYRMAKTGSGRMPHLGSELVDERAIRMMHDWIQQLPIRSHEDTLIERLAKPDAKSKESQQAPPEKSRGELIAESLSSTSRALRLVHAIDLGKLPEAVRDEVAAAAAAHSDPQIRDLFERFLPPEKRVRRLGPAPNTAELLASSGDAARGRDLFLQAAGLQCKTCHQIAGVGGRVGPDLSQIGKKYNRAQLLENLLTPSRTIEPKYQTNVVVTVDGRVLTGVIVERDNAGLVMRDSKDQEIRLAAATIDSVKPVGQSLMPDQMLRDLTLQQAADLVTFLESLR